MLHNVPIYAVMVENLGERGAEYMGLKIAAEMQSSVSVKNETIANKKSPLKESEPATGLQLEWVAVGAALITAAFVLARRR